MPFGEELFCSIEKESPGMEIAQWVGVLDAKLDNLGFILRTHTVEERSSFCEVSVI